MKMMRDIEVLMKEDKFPVSYWDKPTLHGDQQLLLVHFILIFILLLVGLGLSTGAFIMEVLFRKHKRQEEPMSDPAPAQKMMNGHHADSCGNEREYNFMNREHHILTIIN